jgi:hypothetical protein
MRRLLTWSCRCAPVLALVAGVAVTLTAVDAGTPIIRNSRLASTDTGGQQVVNEYTTGLTRFNARDRVHSETLIRGEGRAVMVELK